MQTFLPYKDFDKSAQVLDRQRLGKQRVEARQILETLLNKDNELTKNGKPRVGWKNHPAVLMWSGHEHHLCLYGMSICREWIERGYKDSQFQIFFEYLRNFSITPEPFWLGDEEFHLSHQSNLIRKMPEHYLSKFPGVANDLQYVWPVCKYEKH